MSLDSDDSALVAASKDLPKKDSDASSQVLRSDLSRPSFLHPSSIIFETMSHVKQYIIPAAFGLLGAARGSFWGFGLAAFVFAGALSVTLLRFFTLRYCIQGDDFIVTEGLLFRRVRSVPIRRIQNMDLVQNILHRMFGVAEVKIETASGTKPEATLRVLTHRQIEMLRTAIFGEDESPHAEAFSAAVDCESVALPTSVATHAATTQSQLIYQISLLELIQAGLTSNRGLVLLGVLVGSFFQFDFEKRINLDFLQNYIPPRPGTTETILIAVVAFVALFLLLRVVGIVWYVLRFYGYRLVRHGEDLRISCGLFTKVSASVPRRRIQFISVQSNLLMRGLGLAAIRIETAGGAGSESENAAATVSRRWFLPVVRQTEVIRVLRELRPNLDWQADQVVWHGVSPLTGRRLFRLALMASVVIGGVGMAAWRPWGWVAGVIALPLLVLLARKKSRAKRYARTACGIAYQNGILTRKLSFGFYDRIQTVQVSQSPFDKRWKMATLRIDTAAAGPAEHLIDVDYLDADFAFAQFDNLEMATAQHRPTWA